MDLTRDSIAEILLEKSEYLASEYGVKRIGLFGSYAKETLIEQTSFVSALDFDHKIPNLFLNLHTGLKSVYTAS